MNRPDGWLVPRLHRGIGRWTLDYDWAKRGGRWHDFTDVMLVTATGDDRCLRDALRAWVGQQATDVAEVDGQRRVIVYVGGVQGYLDRSAPGEPPGDVLHLHSHGQDAFDSLSHCSGVIADFLRAQGCEGQLRWYETRHDRDHHQLTWPAPQPPAARVAQAKEDDDAVPQP